MATLSVLSVILSSLLFQYLGGACCGDIKEGTLFLETGTGVSVGRKFSRPFQVSVQLYTKGQGYHHLSSGILFSPTQVLTSADALADVLGFDKLRIVAGIYTLNITDDDDAVVFRYVDEIHVHPNFTQKPSTDSDYAVVILDKALVPSKAIKIIDLPNSEDPGEGTQLGKCTLTGWHLDPLISNPSDELTLQIAPMRAMDKTVCREISEANGLRVKDFQICAEQMGRIKHEVDLGGPLLCRNDTLLVGFGTLPLCGEPGKQPSFFADARLASDWIRSMKQ